MTRVALLVIDMQKAYFNDDALQSRKPQLVQKINELVDIVKQVNGQLFNIYTLHSHDETTWTLNMIEDGQGLLFHGAKETDTLAELDLGDAVPIVKTRDSAFYNTNLEAALKNSGIDTVIICGVSTHACIAQSASDAYAANLQVIIAKDAIADSNSQYHDVLLDLLHKEYRQPILTNHDIKKMLIKTSKN